MEQPPPAFPGLGPEPRSISVTEPISRAIDVTKRILFPLRAGKWFALGFVAWLANLGEGGGGLNLPSNWPSSPSGGSPDLKEAVDWVLANLGLVVMVTVAVIALSVAIAVAITWVSSRAKLMFVHCVARDEAKVEEPWRLYAESGKRLFIVRLYLAFAGLAVVLVGLGLGLFIAYDELRTGAIGPGALTGLVVGVSLIVLGSLPLAIAGVLIEDFVVPALYLHDGTVREAWNRVKSDIIGGNVGRIVLFYLMKFVLGIGIGIIATALTCITCCIAGLPYIGTVILLPLVVFIRAYSMCFIEQFGPDWQLFREPEPPPFESGFSAPGAPASGL